MTISMGTLIGQLTFLLLFFVLAVALAITLIRFLLAATRLMNRKAEAIERSMARSPQTADRE